MKHFLFFIIFIPIFNLCALQNPNIFINEFLAFNVSANPEIVDFDDYSDWIEIYNDENYAIDLGDYFLSDDLNDPTKWNIPGNTIIEAQGFFLFWADGMDDVPGNTYQRPYYPYSNFTTKWFHLNFKLSKSGEEIGLFNQSGELIDSIVFDIQIADVSFGRQPDGSSNWLYFGEPTPLSANNTNGCLNTDFAPAPEILPEGNFYSGSQFIAIVVNSPGARIHYTTDCSKPTSSSPEYITPIEIDSTTIIRSRVFEIDKLPSPIITQTYFIDHQNVTLPIISIATDPDLLWDDEIGIYHNVYKEREIPISFEFYESNANKRFSINGGIQLTGQISSLFPQKSLTFYTRQDYGVDEVDYQIFANREINKFKTLYLRNSGFPDIYHTMFRDALQHSLVINQIDLDCQAYKPTVIFLNGKYWGIYNLREKINKYYFASHHNINPDNIDVLEYENDPTPKVVRGDAINYNALLSFINGNDISLPENYNYIKTQMDIDEYISYMILEIFCANYIWLESNVRWWREKSDKSKWRWILSDMDNGFGMPIDPYPLQVYRHNTLRFATSSIQNGTYNPPLWSTFLFRKLLTNLDFRYCFIQRFASHLNSTFEKNRVISIIDSLSNHISSEMHLHINKWKYEPPTLNNYPIQNFNDWSDNVDILREFALNRPNYQYHHILDKFGLSDTVELVINISNPGEGRILVNEVELYESNSTGTYFKDIPITLEAIPFPGFRFVTWQGIVSGSVDSASAVLVNDTSVTAVFESTNANILPAIISRDTVLTSINSPYLVRSDIIVDSNVVLQVDPGVHIQISDASSIYIEGCLQINGNENNPVYLTKNPNTNLSRWGALCFVNASDSSFLKHTYISGASKGNDFVLQKAAISGFNSTFLLEHVKMNDVLQPVFAQFGNVHIKNCSFQSTISCDYVNIKNASKAIIENSEFAGTEIFDSDAIDYDQLNGGIIRGNRIYNFYGSNSDAIDLGEGSSNILIEDNLIYNCSDKGVSVGQGATAIIKRNVIANCYQGIGIKDYNSYAHVDRNTFYANSYAIACFEKNFGHGGGNADAVNNIFSKSLQSPYFVDNLSNINISYSISDTDILPGINNLIGDPLFYNNFRLLPYSPCINSGNPTSPPDPDGSYADMGAFYYDPSYRAPIIINEIHYNPLEGDDYEFLELYNTDSINVNLTGYRLANGVDFTFPSVSIAADEYIVIAKNANIYNNGSFQVFEWPNGHLSNKWANIQLEDNNGNLIDMVTYINGHGWASAANGYGPSLELRETTLENLIYLNWAASFFPGGTPGLPNDRPLVTDLYINEFLASNVANHPDEFDEFDDWIEIYNTGTQPIDIGGLYITDDLNSPLKWRIPLTNPNVTTIQQDSFLILWADEDIGQGLLHVNIKLSKSGEQIGLVEYNNQNIFYIDSISFGVQTADISYGRYPDAGNNWRFFNTPTPGNLNIILNLDEIYNSLPLTYSLSQNFPNPFNPRTIINFQLPFSGNVKLSIYNILGQEVATLVSEKKAAGYYKVEWDASDLASGVYFYRLESGDYANCKKMVLIR